MKKNQIATIILTMVIGVTGLGLTGCADTVNAHFTGDAVVTSHYTRSKGRCWAKVTFPDGTVESKHVNGARPACNTIKDGGKVTLKNGRVQSFEKK